MIFMLCSVLVSLATSTIIPEGDLDGDYRLREPEIQECHYAKPCLMTRQYAPACGSDGKTYSNRGVIYCLNECLKPEEKVEVVSGGFCKTNA